MIRWNRSYIDRPTGPWTYGALINQLWTVAGDDRLELGKGRPVTFQSENTYDWKNSP